MIDITTLFCNIDDFCNNFEALWKEYSIPNLNYIPKKKTALSLSEVMSIVVLFHVIGYRNFKTFYIEYVSNFLQKDFLFSNGGR